MGIKIEGSEVKVLGGGTQAYNKDTTDKRRPLIMKSPLERQKALKRANDPDIQELEGTILTLQQELQKVSDELVDVMAAKDVAENKLKDALLEIENTKVTIEKDAAPKTVKKTPTKSKKG